jgi:hypothetical protein
MTEPCVAAAAALFELALLPEAAWARFPLFERLLLSICEKEVAVGPGMVGKVLEGGAKTAWPPTVCIWPLWPPAVRRLPVLPLDAPVVVPCVGPFDASNPGASAPVGEVAVLRGRVERDRKDVSREGRG